MTLRAGGKSLDEAAHEFEPTHREVVFRSEVMRHLVDAADRVARVDVPVLIVGERGVGKELLGRRMHACSARSRRPFLAVSCGGRAAQTRIGELLGWHGDGDVWTGRPGPLAGGTLYLAAVHRLSLEHQRRLLRVLQHRGSDSSAGELARPDVRVVCGTEADPRVEARAGRLLGGLARRLLAVEFQVPPLRERGEDILPLTQYFLRRLGHNGVVPSELAAVLRARAWRHNAAELENACKRLVEGAIGGELHVENLPPAIGPGARARSFEEWPPLPADGLSLIDLEKRLIRRVLSMKRGNITHAAAYLRLPRHVLAYRLDKYGLR